MFITIFVLVIVLIIYLSTNYFKRFCNRKLNIQISLDDNRAKEQDEVVLKIAIENRKFLIIPIFIINVNIPIYLQPVDDNVEEENINLEKGYYTYKVANTLLCFQRFKRELVLKPIKRGYYTFEAEAHLIDLFGLCKMYMPVKNKCELYVHPASKGIPDLLDLSTSLQGNKIVRRWINPDPIFYSGVRHYDVGDSFKDIDWKATAKLGDYYVKKYDYTSDPSIMIFFDVFSYLDGKPYNEIFIEKGISLVSAIVDEAYKDKIPVGFATNSYMQRYERYITMPDSSLNSIIMINDMLTCMEYRSWDTLKNTLDKYIKNIMANNSIIFVKYEMTQYLYDIATYLANKRYNVELLLYRDNGMKINKNNIKLIYFK